MPVYAIISPGYRGDPEGDREFILWIEADNTQMVADIIGEGDIENNRHLGDVTDIAHAEPESINYRLPQDRDKLIRDLVEWVLTA